MDTSTGVGTENQRYRNPFRRFSLLFPSTNTFIPNSLSTVLELTGLTRAAIHFQDSSSRPPENNSQTQSENASQGMPADGNVTDVAISIAGFDEVQHMRTGSGVPGTFGRGHSETLSSLQSFRSQQNLRGHSSETTVGTPSSVSQNEERDNADGTSSPRSREQRYDLQQAARWVEQALPFTLLLLMVFLREHVQGFLVSLWLTGLLVKSNDLIRKQAALKGDRKSMILICISALLLCHIGILYWWYRSDKMWRPLAMVPLHKIPGFWLATFVILVNDTCVRYMAMIVKCCILIAHKKSRGKYCRRQAQLLTLVEYTSILYRALIPAPVWYRFFLNEAYGHIFSSLTTGLYLTFKLTSTFDKTLTFIASLRAVSRREVQYGTYATSEEVMDVGDMCAICQEKMHAPISLRCHHVFCEDCVSEWFERERTCPLCRAVVKAAGLRSYGDGSTNLIIQLF